MSILRVEDYSVSLRGSDGRILPAVENVSLQVESGRCLGIAGESGSGKSVFVAGAVGLLPKASVISEKGCVYFKDELIKDKGQLDRLMGTEIGFIFQEPMTAMNPLMTLEEQIGETIEAHCPEVSSGDVHAKVIETLNKSGFSEPEKFLGSYPYQLSGGMRQRAMTAMALVLDPALIIADEPTTAIDAELQVQVITELRRRLDSGKSSMIFISHDLGVMSRIADDLAIFYCGCVVEKGKAADVLDNPSHPYTKALVDALPRLTAERKLPRSLAGTMPSPDKKSKGCVFGQRCPFYSNECCLNRPELKEIKEGHFVACRLVK